MPEVLTPQREAETLDAQPTLPVVPVPPTPSAVPPLSGRRKALLWAAPLAAIALAWGGGYTIHSALTRAPEPASAARAEPDGARLYAQNCAQCHGINGDGKGIALLDPGARYFGHERFKLASTTNGVPTDDDLLGVLRRGIPGSAMPAFGDPAEEATRKAREPGPAAPIATPLSEPELRAVIGHVRELAYRGMYAKLREKAMKDEGDYDPAEIADRAAAFLKPGQPLELPAEFPPPTAETLAQGRAVFVKNCAQCHGPEGRGDGPQVNDKNFVNENGTPARPRNLTGGVFKGGGAPHQIYARVMLGIPGTPMPASNMLAKPDVLALVQYVRSLSQPPARSNGNVALAP